jgi:hypothetical protein
MLEAEQVKQESVISGVTAEKPLIVELPRAVSKRPVRAPFRILWREFRYRVLPTVAFILAVLGAIVMWRQWVTPQDAASVGSVFAADPKAIPFNRAETVAGR